jgi:two-component system, OmpR family, response regulator ChvI
MKGTPKQGAAGLPAYVNTTGAIRILFVEDDERYREVVSDELSEHGFAVQSFGDGASLLDSLATGVEGDIIILDWKLPTTSGIDLLLQLRQQGVYLPVVFLTGLALSEREGLAFERGATDFIDKERGVGVLVRRLRRVARADRTTAAPQLDRSMVCGKLVLKPEIRAYWNGLDVGLTLGEYKIVYLLASNVGRYVTYRTIYDRLTYEGFIAGAGNVGYRANVRSAIQRICNKFRECDPAFAEIATYTGFGYCWGRPVK